MNIYADTSFFVSLYLVDRHSPEAWRRVEQRPRLWLTPFHRAEWTHAVFQHVFRHKMSAREAQTIYKTFEQDCIAGLWMESALTENAFETCASLGRRHTSSLGARMLDSLHVALALELNAAQFWTFDERQAKLAQIAGLQVA